MKCVHMSWMVILVGPAAVGKTSLVELLAHLTGHRLKVMAMNSAMDTTELLGGFEQVNAAVVAWHRFFFLPNSGQSTGILVFKPQVEAPHSSEGTDFLMFAG